MASFLPTLSEDGDPLDVLVLVDAPSFPGCIMQVRPIGLLEMLNQGCRTRKPGRGQEQPTLRRRVENYSEIYPHMLKEMTHFFAIYKDLEGKRVEVKGWRDAAYARTKVVESVNRFKENKVPSELGRGFANRCVPDVGYNYTGKIPEGDGQVAEGGGLLNRCRG